MQTIAYYRRKLHILPGRKKPNRLNRLEFPECLGEYAWEVWCKKERIPWRMTIGILIKYSFYLRLDFYVAELIPYCARMREC